MEVKIGVQNANRELVIDSGQSSDDVEAQITKALASEDGVLVLSDVKGRKVIVPINKLAYVEVGSPAAGPSTGPSPNLSASATRRSTCPTERSSPVSPISPKQASGRPSAAPSGSPRCAEASARATARSAPGSSTRTPRRSLTRPPRRSLTRR